MGVGVALVSARLVEAENLNWRLFRVSDQRLIKCFGKSCRIFELSLHLNWAMPTSLHASIVYIHWYLQHCINFLLLRNNCMCYLSKIENHPNVHLGNFQRHWRWPPLITYLWGLQYLKGRKCNFRDNGELIQYVVFKQLMWVGKLAWSSLNANRDWIYDKMSWITLWAFVLRPGIGVSLNFQPWRVSQRQGWHFSNVNLHDGLVLKYLPFHKVTPYYMFDYIHMIGVLLL